MDGSARSNAKRAGDGSRENHSALAGVFPPMPTPFHADTLEIDEGRLEAHLTWLEHEGADGVVVLGTTGEFASLSMEERSRVARFVLARRGRLEVIVNATATSLPEVLELTREAAAGGACAALVMPPFYYRSAPRAGFIDFFRRVLDRAELPILLYHFPAFSGVDLGVEGVADLAAHPRFAGVKDSVPKIDSPLAFLALPKLRVFVGNDHLVEDAVSRGAAGAITACSNLWPGLVSRIVRQSVAGAEPDALQKTLSKGRLLVEQWGGVVAVKALLERRGLGRAAVRPPLVALDDARKKELGEAIDGFVASMKDLDGRERP